MDIMKEFRNIVRKENRKRSRDGRPRLQYKLEIDGKTYASKSSTAGISS